MVDPVERDLHRHLANIDRVDAIWDHADVLRNDDPETYGEMDDDALFVAAEADLEAQAEDAEIAQYEERMYDMYDDHGF